LVAVLVAVAGYGSGNTMPMPHGKEVLITMNIGGATAGDYRTENQKWWLMKPESRRKLIVESKYIQPPELADVFRSQVSGKHDDLRLKIPVKSGVYKVHLMFAELWPAAFTKGKRLFDIQVGTYMCGELTHKKDFDVFAAAGAGYTGIVETIPHIVTRGGINLVLKRSKQNPILNGIVIEGVEANGDEVNNIGCSGFAGQDDAALNPLPDVPSAIRRTQASHDMENAADHMFEEAPEPNGPRFESSAFGSAGAAAPSAFGAADHSAPQHAMFEDAPAQYSAPEPVHEEAPQQHAVFQHAAFEQQLPHYQATAPSGSTCVNTASHCSCVMRSNNAAPGEMCLFEFNGAAHLATNGAQVCHLGECAARYECSCEGASTMCEKTVESSVLMPLEKPVNGYLRCSSQALNEPAVVLKPVNMA